MHPEKIGFIGVGNLGKPMAVKVAEGGFDLTVYDVRQEALEDLVKLGAKRASSPREVAQMCDIMEVMVAHSDQVEDVVFSPEGILAAARPDSVIIIHSTVGPEICKKVSAACKERGVHVLDAGVSGGVPAAEARSLSVMVGGSAKILDRCRPLFAAFAANVHHIGEEIGSGQIAKILNNHAVYCNALALNETLRIAKAAGLSIDTMLAVINSSSGRSFSSEYWKAMEAIRRQYTTGLDGFANLMHKDLALSLSIAHQHKIPAPAGALAAQYVSGGLGLEELTGT